MTYAAPVLSVGSYRGPLRLLTVGGENLVVAGSNLGTAAQVAAGLYSVALFYGPMPTAASFAGSACAVQADPLSPASTVIACSSVAGTGGPGAPGVVFGLWVSVGGAVSNVLTPTGFGYASPVVASFSGVGAVGARTTGGDAVVVSGSGFGTSIANVTVRYSYAIVASVPGVTTAGGNGTFSPSLVTYLPSTCSIISPDTQLQCTTVAGAGAGLTWSVTVAGQPNTAPTTSYAPPVVTALTVLAGGPSGPVATGANTDGGDVLVITGTGFGPTATTPAPQGSLRLVESVTLVSPAGITLQADPSSWNITSDSSISLTVGAGSGAGWRVIVRVAGVSSATSQVRAGARWRARQHVLYPTFPVPLRSRLLPTRPPL